MSPLTGREFWSRPVDNEDSWNVINIDNDLEDPTSIMGYYDYDAEAIKVTLEASGLTIMDEVKLVIQWRPGVQKINIDTQNTELQSRATIASKDFRVAMYYAINRMTKPGSLKARQQWLAHVGLPDSAAYINQSTIIPWFRENSHFYPDVRFVFYSRFGNIYFIAGPKDATSERHLQYDTEARMWRFIFNIRKFLHIRQDKQRLCTFCNRWHGLKQKCPWRNREITEAEKAEFKPKPQGYHKAVIYADTEALNVPMEDHNGKSYWLLKLCSIGWYMMNGNNTFESVTDKDDDLIVHNFMDAIEENYNLRNVKFVDDLTCEFCASEDRVRKGVSLQINRKVYACVKCWQAEHGLI